MEYRILGPLEVVDDDRAVALGDVTPARVPVYRVDPSGAPGDPLLPPDLEGASIDRVITPSVQLLRVALDDDHVG